MLKALHLSIVAGLLYTATAADACTTFFMSDKTGTRIMGKSYDWDVGHGLAIINRRNMLKRALLTTQDAVPASWQSKFASLTFNQYGFEFPNSGINEAGLAIEISVLEKSVYPAVKGRPAINELQWVQYQLDNYGSVNEMLAHLNDLAIIPFMGEVHFMACDATTTCATIEFIGGRTVVHTGNQLPVKSLTNNNYDNASKFLRKYQGFGGRRQVDLSHDDHSLARFVRASHLARALDSTKVNPVDYAFDIIDNVAITDYNKWRMVYDFAAKRVYFRTADIASIKMIDLTKIQGNCTQPVMILRLETGRAGDATPRFTRYSYAENYRIIDLSLKDEHAPQLPIPDAASLVAHFPENFECQH